MAKIEIETREDYYMAHLTKAGLATYGATAVEALERLKVAFAMLVDAYIEREKSGDPNPSKGGETCGLKSKSGRT